MLSIVILGGVADILNQPEREIAALTLLMEPRTDDDGNCVEWL